MIEPSDNERSNWLDTTRDYVASLEEAMNETLQKLTSLTTDYDVQIQSRVNLKGGPHDDETAEPIHVFVIAAVPKMTYINPKVIHCEDLEVGLTLLLEALYGEAVDTTEEETQEA